MKWMDQAKVFKQRGSKQRATVPYEKTFNWRVVWKIKRKGARTKTVTVHGYGYRREPHARYAMWRYLTSGHKHPYDTQSLILATEHRCSVWAKADKEGEIQKQIDQYRTPVPIKGDDGYEEGTQHEEVDEPVVRKSIELLAWVEGQLHEEDFGLD